MTRGPDRSRAFNLRGPPGRRTLTVTAMREARPDLRNTAQVREQRREEDSVGLEA
jgi:hypothetical protein